MAKYTFKVYPVGQSRTTYRTIEISGEETLDELCEFILETFDFIHEHLYEFCMDNRMYSQNSYQYAPEDGELSTDVMIDEIGLIKGQKFLLHYDFGEDWMFTIHVQKIEDETETTLPKLIKSVGYVEQYPGWDDEEEEF
ncbi:MAG: hypothetical protein OSJ62_00585 [Lachnospiraceae bacterium]|nr:hypothetical protein [Lachnospiraceae bacterium]